MDLREEVLRVPWDVRVPWDAHGTFIERENRFLGLVDIEGRQEHVHIHDPGRLKELLYRGNGVVLKKIASGGRKTRWDLLAASYDGGWAFIHSGYHGAIAEHILTNPTISPFEGVRDIKREVRFGHSRIDFLLGLEDGKRIVLEVKGCTLATGQRALFPDAPTERGRRHLETLMELRQKGYGSAVMMLVFRKARCFAPNAGTDPRFALAFYEAIGEGVKVYPIRLDYTDGKIVYRGTIPICDEAFLETPNTTMNQTAHMAVRTADIEHRRAAEG